MKYLCMKLLLLMLCLSMCIGVFIGCSDDGDGGDNTVIIVDGKGEDRFKNADFNEKSITILVSSDPSGDRKNHPTKYMTGTDEVTSDNIIIAINERNNYIENKLKLNVVYSYLPDEWDTIYKSVYGLYSSNQNVPDAMSNQGPPMFKLMMSDIFMNCNTDDYTNYFDFTDGFWYINAMNSHAFGNDVTNKDTGAYLLISDYFIDYISSLWGVFVNETILESNTQWTTDDLYDRILDGEWTWDVLMSISATAFEDHQDVAENRNGYAFASENATAKNFSPVAQNAHFYNLDLDIFTYENGKYSFNNTNINSKVHSAVDKMLQMVNSKGCVAVELKEPDTLERIYAKNNTLFAIFPLHRLESDLFASLKVCPVVTPKLNPSDSYKSISNEAAYIGGIFNSTNNFTEMSAYWQYQALKSDKTRETYYVDGLGLKYETGENTKEMLDVIYNTIVCEPSYVLNRYFYSNGEYDSNIIVALLHKSMNDGTNQVTSAWATAQEAANTSLNTAINKYNSLQK